MVSDGKMSGMGVFMQKVSQQRFLLQISKVLEKELHLFFHICIFRQQIFFFFAIILVCGAKKLSLCFLSPVVQAVMI